ncbi:sporulation-specific diadenylate cyclase CdaS [Melghirimyces algeriensis]|uniref:Diadenylate cyclase n=1 Tax=Melghirimyces algeriensis TaxID=910412 RepID=A0A521EHT1_9BACL|nr:sporulation-specific diadenylate cyclase CdaS [Melghirimyces algeriensis]SMO83484.1 TIGR00159 family protein [Melghirimyces algeriensis]
MQQTDCDFSPMKKMVKDNLKSLHSEIYRVVQGLEEERNCLLQEIAEIHKTLSQVESMAASFYLQCYLSPYTDKYQELSSSIRRMSQKKHGALIVVHRNDPIDHLIQSGTPIGATLTSSLLESIFYPGSPLHDGAVIVKGNIILSAANLLPLSRQFIDDWKLGTRHRAALGLTENTDALVMIVSEETGHASFAMEGELFPLNISEIAV